MQNRCKGAVKFLISLVILALAFFVSLILGAEKLNFVDLFSEGQNFSKLILLKIRLPRTLLVMVSGALLAGSGACFQLFFKNPLAEPGIMGISSGATLGAVIAQVAGVSTGFMTAVSPINIFAFLFAILSGVGISLLALKFRGGQSSVVLLLCGTSLGTFYSSISSILLLVKSKELHSLYTWILGSFNGRGWDELKFIILPSIISIFLMFYLSCHLDILAYGEKTAKSLGSRVEIFRVLVIVTGALAVSVAVCAGGTISFVGLIAPHIVRKIFSPKGKILVPASLIFGSILLLFSDTLARTVVAPSELPAGVITSILGVPFFLSLILNHTKSAKGSEKWS